MTRVDTILFCRWVIPIDTKVVYENYAIVIHQGKIKDLLPNDQANERYQSDDCHHLKDHAVLPGFVNAHTHSPMVLFKGLADDLSLMSWLHDHIWPAERKWLHEEFIEDGTELAIAEMIYNGTTCFNEHFFFPEVMTKVVARNKIRACIGATVINFPTTWSQDESDGFAKFQNYVHQLEPNPLITVSLAPHAPYSVTDDILKRMKEYADQHNLTIHMHVHETAQEVNDSQQNLGLRPLKRLHQLGLLSPRFQCIHMTQITEEDLKILEETKANIVHCPESNLKLASGYCRVGQLLDKGINVALGTDGPASNNNLDMIGELRTAAYIGKTVADNASAVDAFTALQMATLNGAKALGLADRIGSITRGKDADLIAINLNHANTRPLYNPTSQIVYSATNTQITDVWVAGVQLLRNHKLQFLDEEKLQDIAAKWQQRLTEQ